jgi:phage gp29-like protein
MASIIERFGAMLGSAGSTIQQLGLSLAGRQQQVAPSVILPGVSPMGGPTIANQNQALQQALQQMESYFGRVSYDAGPAWSRFSSHPATDLTPEKIAGAQQEAIAGYPLRWVEMIEQLLGRDAHLMGIAQQRVDDVIKGAWRLIRSAPNPVADCVRSFCNEGLSQVDDFEEALAWLLWSNAYCYNATETTWKRVRLTFPGPGGKIIGPAEFIVPARLDAVHPKHFRFDLRTDEPLLWLGNDHVSLPYGKFIFLKGEGQHPITERRGYMWQCAWLSMFKSVGLAGWATFVERFGLPTPLLKYDDTAATYREHVTTYKDILRRIGLGWGAILPKRGIELSFAEVTKGGTSNDAHSSFADAMDAMESIRVLGATLTAKIGNVGSFAASSSHMEVKYAREEADARRLWHSGVRPQLLSPMVVFNAQVLAAVISEALGFLVTPDMVLRCVPRGLHRVPREIDPLQRGQLVGMAINEWGLRVKDESLYDEFNLVAASGDEDAAPGKPQQVSAGGKVVGSAQASNEGASAPQQQKTGATGGKADGGEGGSEKKERLM